MPSSPEPPFENSLATQFGRLIARPASGSFNSLALNLFAYQFEHNIPFQNFCGHLDCTPLNVDHWNKIPPVPTSAFKLPNHPLVCGSEILKTFLTSGTTNEVRGSHHFPNLAYYDLSISAAWKNAGLPKLPTFFLAPSPTEAPGSSLSHMFDLLNSGDERHFLFHENRFNLAPLFSQIALGQPLFIMGTALAFLHLLRSHQPIPLPEGSHLLETGGYKGTSHELSKPDFYGQIMEFFSLQDSALHNEYSMTELSSQAYATGRNGSHKFPPWCRPLILDPESNQEVPIGGTGYLALYDLANINSVIGIRTQDFAIKEDQFSFKLLGRDPGALPRGCSRTIDDLLTA